MIRIGLVLTTAICTLCVSHSSVAQESPTPLQLEKQRLKNFVEGKQEDEGKLLNPKITAIIQIAKQAEQKIFTPNNNELRKMARDFDTKYRQLLSNDMGRWVGQRPKLVASFLKIDSEQINLSDEALNSLRQRLSSYVRALEAYSELTQGPFDASSNKTALAIVSDANWVNEHYDRLKSRLAVLSNIEVEFPGDQDWSQFPTLQEAKNRRIAEMFQRINSAEQEALDRAAEENAKSIAQSVFDREVQKTRLQISGANMLEEFERDLMQAEFGKQRKLIEKKIVETELAAQRVADDIATITEASAEQRLVDYLTSQRVKTLMAPFCCNGFCEPVAGVGFRKNDSLTKVPMSLSKIAVQNTLSANSSCMKRLIAIANNPDNDRPGWPINHTNYADTEDDFRDMNGLKVNRYVEAQRILREHGTILVELGILRN